MKIFGIFFGANAAKLNEENLLEKVDKLFFVNILKFSKVTFATHVINVSELFKRLDRKVVNLIWSEIE
jgi:hypothetical protein